MNHDRLKVYGRSYEVAWLQRHREKPNCPRLVIVGYQPNPTATEILRLCIDSMRQHTPEDHELWVVDNHSPMEMSEWLLGEKKINIAFNRTEPRPPETFWKRFGKRADPPYLGSYANAVALEIAAQLINPDSSTMMTLHMDTMACRSGWLSYLAGHLSGNTQAAGVRFDTARVRTVHVLGLLFNFQMFRSLGLTFQHNMPQYDVGDAISIGLEKAGYNLWACPNTLWQPELVDGLPCDSPYRRIHVDRSLDDQNNVIFMHLGRGIIKSSGNALEGKTSPEEWLRFGREVVLA